MHRLFVLGFAMMTLGLLSGNVQAASTEVSDLSAARTLFEANLEAIRRQDKDAYLACYWQDPRLTRNGNQGASFGYDAWVPTVGEGWPDVFDAKAMQVTWISPGVVYGSYRYRVVFDGTESTGMSERVFLKTNVGWRIAVTTAFENPASTLPPPLVLRGGSLWSGGQEITEDTVITLKDGLISCVGTRESCGVAEGVDVIDLTGLYVVPDVGRGGVIKVGAPADFVILSANPLRDPGALSRVVYLVSGGEIRAVSEFQQQD